MTEGLANTRHEEGESRAVERVDVVVAQVDVVVVAATSVRRRPSVAPPPTLTVQRPRVIQGIHFCFRRQPQTHAATKRVRVRPCI